MEISFPGGAVVQAHLDAFCIRTDQPPANGGGSTAPSPFDLFLASLGTCAGFYALRFCQERQLPSAGLRLLLETERDDARHRLAKVRLTLILPSAFPEKYRRAIVRAVDQCSVKRTLLDPPEFDIVTRAKDLADRAP